MTVEGLGVDYQGFGFLLVAGCGVEAVEVYEYCCYFSHLVEGAKFCVRTTLRCETLCYVPGDIPVGCL